MAPNIAEMETVEINNQSDTVLQRNAEEMPQSLLLVQTYG